MICKKDSNTYVIVYNGQLYNTKELREELEADNFTFESYSDTEVLLKSYIKFGYNVVNKLNGIFSFAIWDSNKKELDKIKLNGRKIYDKYFEIGIFERKLLQIIQGEVR